MKEGGPERNAGNVLPRPWQKHPTKPEFLPMNIVQKTQGNAASRLPWAVEIYTKISPSLCHWIVWGRAGSSIAAQIMASDAATTGIPAEAIRVRLTGGAS